MKPVPVTPTVAILCFWGGALLLLRLMLAWHSSRTILRRVSRLRIELDAILRHRRSRLASLFGRDAQLANACHLAEAGRTDAERMAAEHAIDERLAIYLAGRTKGYAALEAVIASPREAEDVQAELEGWAARVADSAARYNNAASSLNAARGVLPVGLFLRAQSSDDLTLYGH